MEQPKPALVRCESELWDHVLINFQLNTPLESAPEPGPQPQCTTDSPKKRAAKKQKQSRSPVDRAFEDKWISSALTACEGFAVSRDKIVERYVDDCWERKHPPINTTMFLKMVTFRFPSCQLQKVGSKKNAQLYLIGVQFTPGNAPSATVQKAPSETAVDPQDAVPNTELAKEVSAPPPILSVAETVDPSPRQVPTEVESSPAPVDSESCCPPIQDTAAIGKLAAECLLTNFNGQKNLVPDILWDLTRWSSALQLDQLVADYAVTEGDVVDFLICLRNHLMLVGIKVTENGLDELGVVLSEFWITCNQNVQIRRSVLCRLTELPPVMIYLAAVYQQFYMNLLHFVAPSDRIYFASKKRLLITLLAVLDTWMIGVGKALPGKCGGILVTTTYGFVHTTGILLHLNQNLQIVVKTDWNRVLSKSTRDIMEKQFTGICASGKGSLQTTAIEICEIVWKCMHDPPSRYQLFPSVVQTFKNSPSFDSVYKIRNLWNMFLSTMDRIIPQCPAVEAPYSRVFLSALRLCVAYATDRTSARVNRMSIVEHFAQAFILGVPAIANQTVGKGHVAVDHYLRCFANTSNHVQT